MIGGPLALTTIFIPQYIRCFNRQIKTLHAPNFSVLLLVGRNLNPFKKKHFWGLLDFNFFSPPQVFLEKPDKFIGGEGCEGDLVFFSAPRFL